MWLFLAFLVVPIVEIALFIQVGGFIGLGPTLLIVILTAIAGTWLVRSQGRMALGQVNQAFNQLDNPTEPLAHGAMILFSGALLLTPGFFTDAVGFALLIPHVRMAVFRYVSARVQVQSVQMGGAQFRAGPGAGPRSGPRPGPSGMQGDIIEGEYEEVQPDSDKPRKPSGWVDGPRH